MDPVLVTALAGVLGSVVGGGSAVGAQALVTRRQRKLAHEQWLQERSDWLREQRAEAYVGVLGHLREIDNYHARLIFRLDHGEDTAAETKPTFEDKVTDKVNAFAPKEVREALDKALKAAHVFKMLIMDGQTAAGTPIGSPRDAASPAGTAYREFRAAHRDFVEIVRGAIEA